MLRQSKKAPVTDKSQEAALRESQQIIRAILDAVPARIFWKDKNLIYLGCNAPFARDAGPDPLASARARLGASYGLHPHR